MFNCEPPIDPPCERFTYAVCPNCKDNFVTHDEMHGENPDMKYAWFDKDESTPLCSESCCEEHVEEFGFEYDQEEEESELFEFAANSLRLMFSKGEK